MLVTNRFVGRNTLRSILRPNIGPVKIAKINSEFLYRSFYDKEFRSVLEKSDYVIVDGAGVQWTLKYLSLPVSKNRALRTIQSVFQMIYTGASLVFYPKYSASICERIPGLETFYLMMSVAEEKGISVYILGAEQCVLGKAVKNIKTKFPKLCLVGQMEGWNFKDEDAIRDINESKAELLIVALGSPRQEYWIRDNINKLTTVKVAVGEGGTLDRIANPSQKAPKFVNKIGLEWLWRLFMNKSKTQTGSRLKRVWNAVPVFIYEVVKYKIKNGAMKDA